MGERRKSEDVFPRAPRYSVEVSDHEILRFAQGPSGAKTKHTRIMNLSESGLSFLCPFNWAPDEGEIIKIQFQPPNAESIACFAQVIRIQHHESVDSQGQLQKFKLVAVEYQGLPPAQRQSLSQGLMTQFSQARQQQMKKERLEKGVQFLKKVKEGFSKMAKRRNRKSQEVQVIQFDPNKKD